MEFSRQEYWSGLPFPSPGPLPNPGIEPRSLELQADSLPREPPGKPHQQCELPEYFFFSLFFSMLNKLKKNLNQNLVYIK